MFHFLLEERQSMMFLKWKHYSFQGYFRIFNYKSNEGSYGLWKTTTYSNWWVFLSSERIINLIYIWYRTVFLCILFSKDDGPHRQSDIDDSGTSADGYWTAGQDNSCRTLESNTAFGWLLALCSAGWRLIWRPTSSFAQRRDGIHDYVHEVHTSYTI